MERVNCNLCGSTEHRFVYSMPDVHFHRDEWFDVVECAKCGLGSVNPRPGPNEIGKYYPETFYQYFDHDVAWHLNRYAEEARYLAGVEGAGRSLLDIGCANGDFPRFMRDKGWQVEGVEISANSKPIADFQVYRQDFSTLAINEPRYDAITAWAVLEHVHDPMAYFAKVGQLLKPGGLFVFLVTNFDSLSSKSLFREDPPRHLYFFTKATVKRYLERAGLEFVRADFNKRIYEMRPVGWLRYYLYRCFLGRALTWHDIPDGRAEFFARHQLPNNLVSNLRYALTHPLALVDRILMPVYERIQLACRRYGIVTYVARKPNRG
jgi:SAM-dependent methyltransferase